MEEMRSACRILVVKPEGKDYLEDACIDGRIILMRRIIKILDWIRLAEVRVL
jgi:hypothetical protein